MCELFVTMYRSKMTYPKALVTFFSPPVLHYERMFGIMNRVLPTAGGLSFSFWKGVILWNKRYCILQFCCSS